jgi:hypothetical protein
MTAPMTVYQIFQAAVSLTEAEQLQLNKLLVENIKRGRRTNAAIAGARFSIGQVVRFDAKRKGMKYIKIEKFNRAGTAVVGYECDREGFRFAVATRWTVATTLCSLV